MPGWLGWERGGEASVLLTGLFFQMIESNDISGEKIRMKETVEGEWPLGRRDAGLWGQAGWLCLRAESHLVLRHLPFGERGAYGGHSISPSR